MKRREPSRDTVLRHLAWAADEARKGRAPMALRRAINAAFIAFFDTQWRGRNAK